MCKQKKKHFADSFKVSVPEKPEVKYIYQKSTKTKHLNVAAYQDAEVSAFKE